MSKSSPLVTSRMKKTVGLQREALPGIEETMDALANLRERPMARTLSLNTLCLGAKENRNSPRCKMTQTATSASSAPHPTMASSCSAWRSRSAETGTRLAYATFSTQPNTKEGPFYGTISFDAKGGAAGSFQI